MKWFWSIAFNFKIIGYEVVLDLVNFISSLKRYTTSLEFTTIKNNQDN